MTKTDLSDIYLSYIACLNRQAAELGGSFMTMSTTTASGSNC